MPDLLILGNVTIFTILAVCGAVAFVTRRSAKIKIIIIGALQFAYAGYGIGFLDEPDRYTLRYAVFLVAILTGFTLASRSLSEPKSARLEQSPSTSHAPEVPATSSMSNRLVASIALAYIAASMLQIAIIPGAFRALLRPDQVLLGANQGLDVFLGRLARSGSFVFSMLSYIKLLSLPFVYIWLKRRYPRRWIVILLVTLGMTYLNVIANEHWGRATLLMPILTWLTILLAERRIAGRTYAFVISAGLILTVPVLNAIQDPFRILDSSQGGLLAELAYFQDIEFSYPRWYPLAEAMGNQYDYLFPTLFWLLTLPLPSAITGAGFSVSRDFSEVALSIEYGHQGFYILLPSWLGESFILFGDFYWVWAIIVGTVIGLLDCALSRRSDFMYLDAYFTAMLLIYSRSVSQEYIAQTVNSVWLLVIILISAKLLSRRPGQTSALRKMTV